MKHHLVVFALVTLASEVFAVQGTLVTESEELKGDIRWNAEKKHYVVAIRKGKSIINMQRQSEDVVRLDIPEPDEMEKALTLIEKGSAASAIPLLNKIANDYHRLKWDKIALRHLVMAHLAADNPERAFETCKAVMAGDSTAAYSGELAPAFWQVLLKLGKKPLLEQLLAKAVKHGDRPSSAAKRFKPAPPTDCKPSERCFMPRRKHPSPPPIVASNTRKSFMSEHPFSGSGTGY